MAEREARTSRAVDPNSIDLSKTRLMTVRSDAAGVLETIEAAGDMFVDEAGRTRPSRRRPETRTLRP